MENLLFINACVRGSAPAPSGWPAVFWTPIRQAPGHGDHERNLCAERLQPQYPEVLEERDELWNAGRLDQPMFDPARQFAAADRIVIAAPFWISASPPS